MSATEETGRLRSFKTAKLQGHVAVGATHGSQRPVVTAPKGVAATPVALAPFDSAIWHN